MGSIKISKYILAQWLPEEACSGCSQNSDGLVISLLFFKNCCYWAFFNCLVWEVDLFKYWREQIIIGNNSVLFETLKVKNVFISAKRKTTFIFFFCVKWKKKVNSIIKMKCKDKTNTKTFSLENKYGEKTTITTEFFWKSHNIYFENNRCHCDS